MWSLSLCSTSWLYTMAAYKVPRSPTVGTDISNIYYLTLPLHPPKPNLQHTTKQRDPRSLNTMPRGLGSVQLLPAVTTLLVQMLQYTKYRVYAWYPQSKWAETQHQRFNFRNVWFYTEGSRISLYWDTGVSWMYTTILTMVRCQLTRYRLCDEMNES